jgi:hypothetical protein
MTSSALQLIRAGPARDERDSGDNPSVGFGTSAANPTPAGLATECDPAANESDLADRAAHVIHQVASNSGGCFPAFDVYGAFPEYRISTGE